MAYSIYAYIKAEYLDSAQKVGGWIDNALDDSPWWKSDIQDGCFMAWIKPRFETRGDSWIKPFLESMLELQKQGFLVLLHDDQEIPESGNNAKTRAFMKDYPQLLELLTYA